VEHEQLRLAVIDELIEWTQKYQTFMRRYIEVTPARRDLCFAPTEAKWRLILRQEASIDRQIERKTRLLWEMQEVDGKRRQDERWQEMVRQEAEVAEAREAEARAQEAEQARLIDEATAQVVEQLKKIREQSRQVRENKGPGSEEQGSGVGGQEIGERGQGSGIRDQGSGARGQESGVGDPEVLT
jgi:hypothetical protein